MEAGDTRTSTQRLFDRLEIVIAVALGLAAVATAFSAYQAQLKDGQETRAYNEGIRAISDANQQYIEGNQQFLQDQTLFLRYAEAATVDDDDLAAYLRETLMSEELVAGLEWWEEQEDDELATPFVEENPDYEIPAYEEAEALEELTDASFEEARSLNETGDRYTLMTVILAMSLFLYGIAGVARNMRLKVGTLATGGTVFVGALILLATFV